MHLVTRMERMAADEPGREPGREPVVRGLAGWLLDHIGSLWATRRRRPRQKQMRIVETLAIGGRKQLVLVSCAGERFLVGTGGDSVQTIVRVRAEMVATAGVAGVAQAGDAAR